MSDPSPLSTPPALDALPCGFVQIDAEDRVVHWNQRLERWTRLPRAFTAGRPLPKLFPSSPTLARILAETRAQARPRVLAQQFHRWLIPVPLPAGHISGLADMQQECHLVPLAEPAGHLAITILDVTPLVVGHQRNQTLVTALTTARDQAESARRLHAEGEARLRDLFDNTSELIQSVSPEGRFLFVNAAWHRTLGYTAAELDALTVFDIIDPSSHRHCQLLLRRLLAGENLPPFQTTFRAKSGALIHVEGTLTLRHEIGQPLATRGIFHDITARRDSEVKLIAYQDRLELALAAANTCTWESDVSANVLRLDSRWSLMLGGEARPTLMQAHAALRFVHPDDRAPTMRSVQDCFAGPASTYRVEQRVRTLRGDWIWILSSGRVVSRDSSGRATRLIGTNTDITAQKYAAAEMVRLNTRLQQVLSERTAQLSESEQRYQRLVGLLPVAVYTCDTDGAVTYSNEAAQRLWGLRPALGQPSARFNLWRPDGAPLLYQNTPSAEAIRDGRSSRDIEAVVEQPDGKRIHVLANTDPLHDEAGIIIGAISAVSDVSARKQAEASLRESEQRFRSVFDHSPVTIGLLSFPEGRVLELNAAAETTFGITRQDAIGRTSVELAAWADPADRDRYLAQLSRTGNVRSFETRMRRPDGSILHVLYSGSLITIGSKKYTLNLLLDITARVASDQARERSLALLSATFESAADGILVVDRDGHIENYNRLFATLWQLPSATPDRLGEEALLRAICDQLTEPENFLKSTRELFLRSRQEISDVLHTKDGRVFERYSRPQLLDNEPAGRVWSFRDITARTQAETERVRLETSLRHAQKMESLGTLAGGIAHDFNNILTGYFGFIELTQNALPPTHEAQVFLNYALGTAERARDLVRQILTFSRRHEGERKPVQLGPVVAEALRLLRATIPAMVTLRSQLDPACPLVHADPTQVHQIVMNLCTNAWHAVPPAGGVIIVGLAPAPITPEHAVTHPRATVGPAVRLTVTDNGSGMSAATLARIFEPFFTTKETGQGTGLGLAVASGIVDSHGGVIEVRSTPGQGTTFEVYLPALATSTPPFALTAATAPVLLGHGEPILWVDDDPVSGQVIGFILERLNYRVTRFSNPLEALACFCATPDQFSLVITDLAMPHISGAELAAQFLQLRPTLPLLVISGYVDSKQQESLLRSGVRAVLRKPITRAALAAAITRYLPAPQP